MGNYKLSISRLISIFVVVMIFMACSFSLSGNSAEDTNSLTILISNPLEDFTISSGEEISITSTAFSDSGISHVELLVNDQVFEIIRPQDTDEQTFVAILSWTPTDTGIYRISVTVEDLDGQRAESDQLFATVETQAEEQSNAPTATDALPAPTDTQAPDATPEPSPTSGGSIDLAPIIVSPIPFVFTPNPTSGFVFNPIPIIIPLTDPSGPPAIQFAGNYILMSPDEVAFVDVQCPSGSVVTGGGYYSTATSNLHILGSYLDEPNGWIIKAYNKTNGDQNVGVMAVCLSNSGGSIEMVENLATLQGGEHKSISAVCPSGSVVTGGGWLKASNSQILRQSSQAGNNWAVSIENHSNSSTNVGAYAVCLSGSNATSYQFSNSLDLSAGDQDSVFALCQPGQLVSSGGLYGGVYPYANGPIGPNATGPKYGWGTYADNPAHSATFNIKSFATCLSFP
jgi:hypothetical protein